MKRRCQRKNIFNENIPNIHLLEINLSRRKYHSVIEQELIIPLVLMSIVALMETDTIILIVISGEPGHFVLGRVIVCIDIVLHLKHDTNILLGSTTNTYRERNSILLDEFVQHWEPSNILINKCSIQYTSSVAIKLNLLCSRRGRVVA